MKRIAVFLTALCIVLCTGCDSGYDCSLNNIAYNRVNFYTTNEHGIESPYALPEALTVSIMVNGRDSIVVNHITGTKELTLPMSYTSDCDTLTFDYWNGITDTLYVGHKNIPFYQSMECGVIMHHTLTEVKHTGNLIDSMAINTTQINFDYNENIKLYFIE
ncbi:MAG: hypothetical protein IIW75_00365 [Bacteroidaceae bacterium]|nr:hypothetical protein [Bacteroidaceae bacterium]